MSGVYAERSRRNASIFGATAVTVGALFLYPTSTNGGGAHKPPGTAAAAGVVAEPSAPSASSGAARTLVVNGTAADTQYGPVQVQLRIRAGRIVRARAIEYPQGSGRDQQINSYAIPVLDREVVAAQSAHIDSVSGATYTSEGYLTSLQAALDAAHLH